MRTVWKSIFYLSAIAFCVPGLAADDDAAQLLKARPRASSGTGLMSSVSLELQAHAKQYLDLSDAMTASQYPARYNEMRDLWMRRNVAQYGELNPQHTKLIEAEAAMSRGASYESLLNKSETQKRVARSAADDASAELRRWEAANLEFCKRKDSFADAFRDTVTLAKRDGPKAAREIELLKTAMKDRQTVLAQLRTGESARLVEISAQTERELAEIVNGAGEAPTKIARIEQKLGIKLQRVGGSAMILVGALGFITFAGNNQAMAAQYNSVEAVRSPAALVNEPRQLEENHGAPASGSPNAGAVHGEAARVP